MKVLKIFFIFLLIITISIVGIISYWKIKESLINDGYYNVYNYEMNDKLIKEINSYVNEDYYINLEKFKQTKEIVENQFPILSSISFNGYKTQDGIFFYLISNNVAEYIYYCHICNFEIDESYYDYGQEENMMIKGFGSNIVKINDNIYHVYYNPILDF